MKGTQHRTFFPRLRITELVKQPGGLYRNAACKAGSAAVEALREQSMTGIAEAISDIQAIMSRPGPLETGELAESLRFAERIVNLAETFGCVLLGLVAKSLCDLTDTFLERGAGKAEPLLVHLTTMRLVMPHREVTQAEAQRLLGELSRVLMAYGCLPREALRLDALYKLELLDTGVDRSMDALVAAVKAEFHVSIAAISLVDSHRQWFKSRIGIDVAETPRSMSFCTYAIEADEVFVVEDAALDPRFTGNALVTGAPNVRFYAGTPLRTSGGQNIGALCIIDCDPRTFSADERTRLGLLGRQAMEVIEGKSGSGVAAPLPRAASRS